MSIFHAITCIYVHIYIYLCILDSNIVYYLHIHLSSSEQKSTCLRATFFITTGWAEILTVSFPAGPGWFFHPSVFHRKIPTNSFRCGVGNWNIRKQKCKKLERLRDITQEIDTMEFSTSEEKKVNIYRGAGRSLFCFPTSFVTFSCSCFPRVSYVKNALLDPKDLDDVAKPPGLKMIGESSGCYPAMEVSRGCGGTRRSAVPF